jgi:ATP-binding cassette, subfamily B (MDR/TAP), member 1
VASFTGEKLAIQNYNNKLQKAYGTTVKQGLALGLGFASFLLTFFAIYGLAMWYGSKLVIEKGYKGGDVLSVMIAIMIGGT